MVSDSFWKLCGSWDLIEEKYPKIAENIKTFLFGKYGDLAIYAIFEGDLSNGYETIRQNIIEFVRANFYKKEDKDIGISVKINGKDISKCTVKEIYQYVRTQITDSHIDLDLENSLYDKALQTYIAYNQFLTLMKTAKINKNNYADIKDQFKNSLLDILKEN